jgi:hypothetical protein
MKILIYKTKLCFNLKQIYKTQLSGFQQYRTNTTGSINSSSLFILSNSSSKALAALKSFSFDEFEHFIRAVSRVSNLNLTSSMKVETGTNLLFMYIITYYIHNSFVVSYLCNSRRPLYIPQYMYSILTSIACEVRSTNKLQGYTLGKLITTSDWGDVFDAIQGLVSDSSNFRQLFENTILHSLVQTNQSSEAFRLAVITRLKSYSKDMSEDHLINQLFSELSSLDVSFLSTGKGTLPMYRGYIDYSLQGKLGIYRFRKASHLMYVSAQSSCAALDLHTLNYLASFLIIGQPTFYSNKQDITSNTLYSGEGLFIMTEADIVSAWETYVGTKLAFTKPHSTAQPSKSLSNKKETSDDSGEDIASRGYYAKFYYPLGNRPVISDVIILYHNVDRKVSHKRLIHNNSDLVLRPPCG